MNNIVEVVDTMKTQAAKKTMKEYRIVRLFGEKASVRQGDVYILAVPESCLTGKPTENRQLAPGSSKGSRHIIEGAVTMVDKWTEPAGLKLFEKAAKSLRMNRDSLLKALMGPAIKATGAFRVTHPEHADFTLPAGCYVTWGQLDPKTMRRVQD